MIKLTDKQLVILCRLMGQISTVGMREQVNRCDDNTVIPIDSTTSGTLYHTLCSMCDQRSINVRTATLNKNIFEEIKND